MFKIGKNVKRTVVSRYGFFLAVAVLLASVGCGQSDVEITQESETSVEPVESPTMSTETADESPGETENQLSNDSWESIIEEFEGVKMTQVPAGCFMMGETGVDRAEPVHEVCITEPYWIDMTEVSNRQFRELGGVAERESAYPGYEVAGDDQPRTSVTWEEAAAFCQLRGARLPTEAEWEFAARGPAGWSYPWGIEFEPTLLNACDQNCNIGGSDQGEFKTADDGYAAAAPVESFPGGASWVGALHMAGNVAEWVADWYGANYYSESGRDNPTGPAEGSQHVVKSIPWSWYIDLDSIARSSNRWDFIPDATGKIYSGATGFRCVMSAS